jgi:hypothetical protein
VNVEYCLLSELYFASNCFGQRRQAVLYLELIDLAVPHLSTEPDELDPRRM